MAEYIDREAALDCFACDLGKKDYSVSYQGFMTEAAFRINEIPSADVRPVVTCGECLYFRLNSCMRWADGTFMERTDFCSRAAKREKS